MFSKFLTNFSITFFIADHVFPDQFYETYKIFYAFKMIINIMIKNVCFDLEN